MLYEAYFFGYGSLMNIDELVSCLQTTEEDIISRIQFVRVTGLRRGWLNQCKGVENNGLQLSPTYLCCYDTGNNSDSINGIILPVTDEERSLIHDRERKACYGIKHIKHEQVTCYTCQDYHLEASLSIYLYCCQLDLSSKPNEYHPIVESYIDLCLNGTLNIDKLIDTPDSNFSREFISTTDFWPKHYWINDRIYKYRPTIHQPLATTINKLLIDMLPQDIIESISF